MEGKKGSAVNPTVAEIIIAVIVLALVIGGIYLGVSGKATGAISYIKDKLSFGFG